MMVQLREKTVWHHKKVLSVVFCGVFCVCSGCGTLVSRCGNRPFGAYPYRAVQWDVEMGAGVCRESHDMFLNNPGERTSCISVGGFALLSSAGVVVAVGSSALDLILDTLFLPADLAFWSFGVRKKGMDF
jgi:uncharacterized protein YceK